jgi:hypothetical protein
MFLINFVQALSKYLAAQDFIHGLKDLLD